MADDKTWKAGELDKAGIRTKIKTVKQVIKDFRPDKNNVQLPDGTNLAWKIKPGTKSTKFGLTFDKNFADTDVEITVKIGGEVNYFNSPKGVKDVITSASFCATKKF